MGGAAEPPAGGPQRRIRRRGGGGDRPVLPHRFPQRTARAAEPGEPGRAGRRGACPAIGRPHLDRRCRGLPGGGGAGRARALGRLHRHQPAGRGAPHPALPRARRLSAVRGGRPSRRRGAGRLRAAQAGVAALHPVRHPGGDADVRRVEPAAAPAAPAPGGGAGRAASGAGQRTAAACHHRPDSRAGGLHRQRPALHLRQPVFPHHAGRRPGRGAGPHRA